MPDIKLLKNFHKKKILKIKTETTTSKQCNCVKKAPCPMDHKCLTDGTI